ncbi:MAG: hypothetical protein K5669_03685 [Lachnospiraceae bacterium]|nr:hypothetical protein [Lachnospiraceae bacterium]
MTFEDRIIYLARDSFCMGDDVMAPNMRSFTWRDGDHDSENDIYGIIEQYLGVNLPDFYWRGYANGEMIVDVNIHSDALTFTREIRLVETWQELLRASGTIYFCHQKYENRELLPITIDRSEYFTYEESEEILMKNGLNHITRSKRRTG